MKLRLLLLLMTCCFTMAGIAQDKPKSGLGKILGKADTLLKKVDKKIGDDGEKPLPSAGQTMKSTPAFLSYPASGALFDAGTKNIEFRGTGDANSQYVVKLYKVSDDPYLVQNLKANGKGFTSAGPLETYDFRAASEKQKREVKNIEAKINGATDRKTNSANITAAISKSELSEGSWFAVLENTGSQSNPVAFSVSGALSRLDIFLDSAVCKGFVNGKPQYQVVVTMKNNSTIAENITYEFNSSNNITYFSSPANLATCPIIPTCTQANIVYYPNGSINSSLSIYPASIAPGQTLSYTLLVTPTNATDNSIRLIFWASSKQGVNYDRVGKDITIPVKFCNCNFCETVKWDVKKGETTIAEDRRGNWFVTINDNISIPGQTIKSFKAEITGFNHKAANKNEECITCNKNSNTFGNLTAGTLTTNNWGTLNGVLTPIFDAAGNSNGNGHHTLNWFTANGASTTMGGNIRLNISIPPFSTIDCCDDEVAFCIRYTFTTADCKTCSKVVCYTGIKRVHK